MSVCEAVQHYQKSIEKCSKDEDRMLHCIQKLYGLPVSVQHLQDTGVGRTVNALRKFDGEVGLAARALVCKWKAMVAAEESSPSEGDEEGTSNNISVKLEKDANSDMQDLTIYKNERIESLPPSGKDKEREKNTKKASSEGNRESDSPQRKRKAEDDVRSHKKLHTQEDHPPQSNHIIEIKKEKIPACDTDKHISRKHHSSGSIKSQSRKHKSNDRSESRGSKSSSDTTKRRREKQKTNNNNVDNRKPSTYSEESSPDYTVNVTVKVKSRNGKDKSHNSATSSSKDISHSGEDIKPNNIVSNNVFGVKVENEDDGINSYSGPSFAEALGMIGGSNSKNSTPKKKANSTQSIASSSSKTRDKSPEYMCSSPLKESRVPPNFDAFLKSPPNLLLPTMQLAPLNLDLSYTMPIISPNYRPLPYITDDDAKQQKLDANALGLAITSKNQRTKVFSGNKCGLMTQVPTLYEMCIRVLQENIDALEYTGGVPYDILRPVLDRATPNQLFNLEHHNPYLIDDTDALWEFHCKKKFRGKQRQEMEGWREMYLRCQDEQDAKLRSLTDHIKQSQDKSTPIRKAKLAYLDSAVKPPRNVARKQAIYGTARAPVVTPAARVAALSGSSSNMARAGDSRCRVLGNGRDHAQTTAAHHKPRAAPLMQKTLACMRGLYKRK